MKKEKMKLSFISKTSLFLFGFSCILLLWLFIQFGIYAHKFEDANYDVLVFGTFFYLIPVIYYLIIFLINYRADRGGKKLNKLTMILLLVIPVALNISSILSSKLEWASASKHTQVIKNISVTFPSDFKLCSTQGALYNHLQGVTFCNDGCLIGFEAEDYEKGEDFLTHFKSVFGQHFNVYDQDQIYLSSIDINGKIWKYYHRAGRNNTMYSYAEGNYFYSILLENRNDSQNCNKKLYEVFDSIIYK